MANNTIHNITVDSKGILWFATRHGGISLFDGVCFQTIGAKDGLSSDSVYYVYMDRSGDVWVSTLHNGINRFTLQR